MLDFVESELSSVAKKVSNTFKQTIQGQKSKVATTASSVGNRLMKTVAQGVARTRVLQKAPALMKNTHLKGGRSVASASRAPLPSAPKKKLSAKALGFSASQMRELEQRLYALQAELKGHIELKSAIFNIAAQSESIIKGDDAEVAEKQRVSNAVLQEIDFLKNRVSLVGRAIAKIDAGVFGLCEESEEPIGYERLSVVPWARFSVNVQEMHERKMKDYKVSRLRAEG